MTVNYSALHFGGSCAGDHPYWRRAVSVAGFASVGRHSAAHGLGLETSLYRRGA